MLIYENPSQDYQNPYQNNPFDSIQLQTPQNPYKFPSISTTPPQRFTFNPVSTSRSPYDFNQFSSPTPNPYLITPDLVSVDPNENSFLGNYFNTLRKTTKSPYDFGNFGRTSQNPFNQNFNDNIDNNYLKRSYNLASFYSDSSNLNKTVVNGRLSI